MLRIKSHHVKRYFGLPNLGNTCYANSVIQALIKIPFHFFSPPEVSEEGSDKILEVSFWKLVLLSNNISKYNSKLIDPNLEFEQIIDNMSDYKSIYQRENNNDPCVFFRDLINLLPDYEKLFQTKIKNEYQCTACFYSENFVEQLNDFEVDIDSSSNISDMIYEKYFTDEVIEAVQCIQCNETCNMKLRRTIDIDGYSSIMVISLRKKGATEIKINAMSTIKIKSQRYSLFSAILFNQAEKHYICQMITENETYFIDNTKLNRSIDLGNFNFLPSVLFYKKCTK